MRIVALAAIVALASQSGTDTHMVFDSDSHVIVLDNCASFSMTDNMNDFIDTPVPVTTDILGVGKVKARYRGTVNWTIEDDDGNPHSFPLPDTYFTPGIPMRIMSIQHWRQVN